MSTTGSLVEALAYIVAESTDIQRWRDYATQVLGMQAIDAPGGALWIKMDERDFRLLIQPGSRDAYLHSGLDAGGQAEFRAAIVALEKAGIAVEQGSAERIAARRVRDLVSFTDPAGNCSELVWGYTGGATAFESPLGAGFKTGRFGVGHTVLPAIPFEPTLAVYHDVLGMGLSDVFAFQPGPGAPTIRIDFLHGRSGRHHSVALAEMPNPAGCVHMMVEVDTLTDVGRAYDRMRQHGVKEMATLGEHENDRMTSFYMMTPSGFAVEYGWGGLIVDPTTWETTQTKQVSLWGHDFSVGFR